MREIIRTLYRFVNGGESVVLASVVKQSGSTPRGTGAKMIIRENKEIVGTIGGGSLEKKVQVMAANLFKTKTSALETFTLTEDDIAKLGMICGGNVTVYLQFINSEDSLTLYTYEKVLKAFENNEDAWLITAIMDEGKQFNQYLYVKTKGGIDQTFSINTEDFNALKNHFKSQNIYLEMNKAKYLIEPLSKVSKAYIFGGGHVGLEIAIVLKRLGFQINVIDDREAFCNKDRFPMADNVICANMAEDELFQQLNIDENSYIIIVTRGHMYDGEVLAQALKTPATYIGMIGSRGKRDKIYKRLMDQGYTSSDIERVYSPIGLPIKAETPEEIAISIAAELIKVRAEINE